MLPRLEIFLGVGRSFVIRVHTNYFPITVLPKRLILAFPFSMKGLEF